MPASKSPKTSSKGVRKSAPSRRRAGHAETDDTETRILDAARRVFTAKGTAGARMQDIAREAGVNQALLHYYFRNKAALSERVFIEAASRLLRVMPEVFRPGASLEEMVTTFVEGYLDAVRQTPFLPGYVLAEMHQDPARVKTLLTRISGHDPQAVLPAAIAQIQTLLDERAEASGRPRVHAEQVLFNVLALSAFPFVARPILSGLYGQDAAAFERFLDTRRRELPAFILNAIP